MNRYLDPKTGQLVDLTTKRDKPGGLEHNFMNGDREKDLLRGKVQQLENELYRLSEGSGGASDSRVAELEEACAELHKKCDGLYSENLVLIEKCKKMGDRLQEVMERGNRRKRRKSETAK